METLVDHNLIAVDRTVTIEDVRFTMLETIRSYSFEQIEIAGEYLFARRYHANWFLEQAREVENDLTGGRQNEALSRVENDHGNFRAAIEWGSTAGQIEATETSLNLIAQLWRFWWLRGYFSEGERLIELALSASQHSTTLARAKALNAAGVMAFSKGNFLKAREYHEESVSLCQSGGFEEELAKTYDNLRNHRSHPWQQLLQPLKCSNKRFTSIEISMTSVASRL